jgi:hypothetical protein
MRIDGPTSAENTGKILSSRESYPAGALVPLGPGKGREGHAHPFFQAPADEFVLVHDASRGPVVVDLFLAALQYDEPPTYHLTERGAVAVGMKPRKGGIIDLLA